MKNLIKILAGIFVVASSSAFSADIQKDIFTEICIELKADALRMGIEPQLVHQVIDSLSFKKDIVKKDGNQPANTETTESYVNQRVRPTRVKAGKEFLHQEKAKFEHICKTFGVDFELLISLWAVETDFGTNMGKFDSFSGMATLMTTRRKDFFKKEFLTLLQLVHNGIVRLPNLVGEWAGAHGHFQFMPTTIAKYGVDADGDGVIDLKNSLQDAFASAANYMRVLGWKYGQPWGYEVALTQPLQEDLVSVSSRNLKIKLPLKEWIALGVVPFNTEYVNHQEAPAWLMVADGQVNKYYVIFDNFKSVLRWNNSFKYGLMVCSLMDMIKS